jgi:hypothetical protein
VISGKGIRINISIVIFCSLSPSSSLEAYIVVNIQDNCDRLLLKESNFITLLQDFVVSFPSIQDATCVRGGVAGMQKLRLQDRQLNLTTRKRNNRTQSCSDVAL